MGVLLTFVVTFELQLEKHEAAHLFKVIRNYSLLPLLLQASTKNSRVDRLWGLDTRPYIITYESRGESIKRLFMLALQSLVSRISGPQDYTKPCIQCISYTHLAE